MTGIGVRLAPRYMQDFRCVGSACEDSCCVGWRVDIDRKTFKFYQKTPDAALNRLLEKRLGRNRSSTSDARFGFIRLNADGSCPFLDEQRLCRIQGTLGEQALSETCATFPRVNNAVDHLLEQSATLACPEAARLALLSREPMAFDTKQLGAGHAVAVASAVDTQSANAAEDLRAHFWRVRLVALELLQNRTYRLWERLVLLGLFVKRVDALLKNREGGAIDAFADGLLAQVADRSVEPMMRDLGASLELRMALVAKLIEAADSAAIRKTPRFQTCLEWFKQGIGWREGQTIEALAAGYQSAQDLGYEPFEREHGYVLENYLVNHVFKTQFPLGATGGAFGAYFTLVIHYVILKTHLVGMCGFHREAMTTEHAVMLIQSFAKTIEHTQVYIDAVRAHFERLGLNNLAAMSILLKDERTAVSLQQVAVNG